MNPINTRPAALTWRRRLAYAAGALLLQVGVFGWVGFDLDDSEAQARSRRSRKVTMKGRFIKKVPRPEEEPVTEPPEEAQIVELTQPPEEPDPQDKTKTKYLADRTTRTDKQTRSRRVAKPDRTKTPGKVRPKKASRVQSRDSDSVKETSLKTEAKRLALMRKKDRLPKANRGEAPQKSVLHHGDKSRLFMPSTSAKAERNNLQAASGSMATDDHLKDVERSDRTVLNADKYKHRDFFYRVKDAVRRYWKPNVVYRRRDPTGKLYGVKDRHTILSVTLDSRGRLQKLVTRRHSGLDFMDAEARNAFKRAQPFPNPPQDLVREGKVRFDFGFYFEISSGRSRFRWRQR